MTLASSGTGCLRALGTAARFPGSPVKTPPPLRILHLDAGREWRGGQRQVYLLARGQRELGHEPLVIAAPDAPLLHRLRSAGIAAAEVRIRGDWDLAAASRVRAALRTSNADVIHAHDAHAHAIALAALIGRRSVPLIVSRRVVFVPHGRLKYGHRVSRFIAVSDAVRHALMTGGIDGSRVELVYDGVARPTVAKRRDWRAECGWPADSVVCGIVGAMSAEKGVAMLSEIRDRLPEPSRRRIRLVLLGGKRERTQSIGGLTTFLRGLRRRNPRCDGRARHPLASVERGGARNRSDRCRRARRPTGRVSRGRTARGDRGSTLRATRSGRRRRRIRQPRSIGLFATRICDDFLRRQARRALRSSAWSAWFAAPRAFTTQSWRQPLSLRDGSFEL